MSQHHERTKSLLRELERVRPSKGLLSITGIGHLLMGLWLWPRVLQVEVERLRKQWEDLPNLAARWAVRRRSSWNDFRVVLHDEHSWLWWMASLYGCNMPMRKQHRRSFARRLLSSWIRMGSRTGMQWKAWCQATPWTSPQMLLRGRRWQDAFVWLLHAVTVTERSGQK